MNCANHPQKSAEHNCHVCSSLICDLCSIEWHGKTLCPSCIEQQSPHRKLAPKETSAFPTVFVFFLKGWGYIFLLYIIAGTFFWIGAHFFGIYCSASPNSENKYKNSLFVYQQNCGHAIFPTDPDKAWLKTTFRLERRSCGNLKIYINRYDFESIPFPDRPKVVSEIGRNWYEILNKQTIPSSKSDKAMFFEKDLAYVPTVSICDIRTGEIMAKFCSYKAAYELYGVR